MKFELTDEIQDALTARISWANRQTTFYKVRHQGLRRINKPYPNAADLHFPLVDSLITKLKPFYYQQLYATEQFASFVSLRSQLSELTSAKSAWFDYKLKQKTNIEREIMAVIDFMEQAGRAPLKVSWDTEAKCICFDAVDPTYFIVPVGTTELQEAPWCVHVIHMSKSQYKKVPQFKQDETFVKSIMGRGTDNDSASNWKWQEKCRREGLTYGQSDDQIVIWEIYQKEDDQITVDTFSPMQMESDKAIRPQFKLTYNHKQFPFIAFRTEIKDKGWYSPRGIPEKHAAFEDSICRLWNGKHDCIDYYNKPLFKNNGDLTNTSVVRFLPGQTLPRGVEPVQQPSPPIDFDQEMQNIRATSEYYEGLPDLGSTQHLSAKPGTRGDVTATQINAIVGQSGMSDDMRARIFRLDLADMYRMADSLYMQFDKQSLIYVLNDEQLSVPPEALHSEYAITPNGSADSWNKPLQMQKAVGRLQMFRGSPYWKQNELEKSVMEIDDPRLIKRLYQDPGDELKDQMEAQAEEIAIMLLGFPAQVQRGDDDKAHLQSLQGFVDRRLQTGEPITPEFARLALQHVTDHDQALMQKKDKMIGQVRQQMAPLIQYLSSIAQQDQQLPQNVIGMPGAPSQPGAMPSTGEPAPDPAKAAKDQQDSASKLISALSGAIKSGVPITHEELNTALAQAGLPPLQATQSPPIQPPQPMNAGAGAQ